MREGPLQVVARALRRGVGDLRAGELVLVACSGGPDSLALAAAAARLARRSDSPMFGAIIVDHQMQPGSDLVAAAAAASCRDLGMDPVDVQTVQVPAGPGTGGPEAAARTVRRSALESAALSHGARAILLAHTLDDQAETVLLGLARGSGARSLAGMAAVDGIWRRPLLGLRRDVTYAASLEAGLEPFHDPQNSDDRFARSRVRMSIMPVLEAELGPGMAGALARTADMLRADCDALDDLAKAWMRENRVSARATVQGAPAPEARDVDMDEAAVSGLADASRAIRTRVLRSMLIAVGAPPTAITFEHVMAVDALVTAWHGQGPISLPGGVTCTRTGGRVVLRRQATGWRT